MGKNKYSSEISLMMSGLSDFISDSKCYNEHKCNNCSEIEECYMEANSRCNSDYAKSIDFGGYDSEEEFWENL